MNEAARKLASAIEASPSARLREEWDYYRNELGYPVGYAVESIDYLADDEPALRRALNGAWAESGLVERVPADEPQRRAYSSARGAVNIEFKHKGVRYDMATGPTFSQLDKEDAA